MTANTEHIFNTGARSRIDAAITASATSLTLIPGGVVNFLPGWASGKEFYCTLVDASRNREIVKVTAISDHTFTIVRGQDSSTARAWPIGTMIAQRPVAANYDRFIQKGFRTVTYNPNGVLTGAYDGEKVYQSNNLNWWISMGGTVWKSLTVPTDAVEVISSTSDCTIYYFSNARASSWDYVHDLATGTDHDDYDVWRMVRAQRYTSNSTVRHAINRAFFYFDLSGLSGTVAACQLRLMGDPSSGTPTIPSVMVQQGTQADPATTADFDSFTGLSFGVNEAWVEDDFNIIDFNALGIAYIQTVIAASGTALLCCREYDHDYLDVGPEGVINYTTDTYYTDHATVANRPALLVTAI